MQGQQDLEGSALAVIQSQSSAGPPHVGAGLVQEVAALRGLLQRVAPHLDELAGLKQQMGQLMSALQPGNCIHRTTCWLWTTHSKMLQDSNCTGVNQTS